MSPGKSGVGKNPRLGIDAKNKQRISRVPITRKILNDIRLRRLRKKLGQK